MEASEPDLTAALKQAAIANANAAKQATESTSNPHYNEHLANAAKALTEAYLEAATMDRKAKRGGRMVGM